MRSAKSCDSPAGPRPWLLGLTSASLRGLLPLLLAAMAGAATITGCAHQNMVPGTQVQDTEDNRAVLAVIEQYRQRLTEKNVEGLLLLASDRYFEDSGTPSAVDDYGYDGLKFVLANR